ncbi:MAG: hypothetical protein B7Z10_09215 [Rhodobacterales bacterium 32-66-7]|nr:MAG: hypothetical protein B7Z31_06470 [Rhodobacterales bacterium 12-65-15]OYX24436.1 MAG: hypothetical protein B7Z10_09215 [Rhodobacterales bacterium 32-66-7]
MQTLRDPIASWNERLKLVAAFLNAIGLGMIGFAVLKPLTEDITSISLVTVWWGLAGLAFHAISLYVLGKMRKAAP